MLYGIKNYSDVNQDIFVTNILNEKKNGYFLEIGSGRARQGNNTYVLETEYNWKGIMIDSNENFLEHYQEKRPSNSNHIISDATTIDYKEELKASTHLMNSLSQLLCRQKLLPMRDQIISRLLMLMQLN